MRIVVMPLWSLEEPSLPVGGSIFAISDTGKSRLLEPAR
jgi:hypothetical protein